MMLLYQHVQIGNVIMIIGLQAVGFSSYIES